MTEGARGVTLITQAGDGGSRLDRRVFLLSDNILVKLESDKENTIETEDTIRDKIIKDLIPLDVEEGFRFWNGEKKLFTVKEIITKYPELKDIEFNNKNYRVRECKKRGENLETLINFNECKYCFSSVKTESKKMNVKIENKHISKFIIHLLANISLLHEINISHSDLRLANIIVEMNEEEKKNGIITESLPLLIDFGLAKIGDNCDRDVIGLFRTCPHGNILLQEGERMWLSYFAADPEDEKLKDILKEIEKLNLKKSTLRDLMSIFQSHSDET